MQILPERSSQWMVEFHKQLVRGKHVILYGNVADQFLLNDRYLSMQRFLGTYFREEGYELFGQYDIVDGIQLLEPAMRATFDRLVLEARGGSPTPAATPASRASAAAPAATPQRPPDAPPDFASPAGPPPPPSGTPPRRPLRAGVGTGGASGQPGPLLVQPDQAFDAVRIVLAQAQVATAMVLDFTDKLVSDPERQSEAELRLLVQAKKVLQQAAFLHKGVLAGRKNTLVIVAGQLGCLPPWLYHENPFVALVQVGRPRLEERATFIRTYLARFEGGRDLPPPKQDEVVRDFADLTDGLTAWDLEAIRRTSLVEHMTVERPRVLVDYYKYGQRDDPWERLDAAKIRSAQQQMEARVIGQPVAIRAVVDMLLAGHVGISMSAVTAKAGKPKGTFFFVGPTGVGKTELAKALTALIFGDDTAFARFDMSEYAQEHDAQKLTGAPPSYVGYEEGGQLTKRVQERPFSLLLFDEIEKAHGRVMDKFLQILEDGRLTDGKGQTAYFSQTVIIFTSNIGSDALDLHAGGDEGKLLPYERVRAHYLQAVRNHFTRGLGRPELLNRLGDNVLVFDLLRPEYIAAICRKFVRGLAESARERRGLVLEFPGEQVVELVRRLMLIGDNMLFGGRRIKTILEAVVERPLNRWVFFNPLPPGGRVVVTVDEDGLGILVNGKPVP